MTWSMQRAKATRAICTWIGRGSNGTDQLYPARTRHDATPRPLQPLQRLTHLLHFHRHRANRHSIMSSASHAAPRAPPPAPNTDPHSNPSATLWPYPHDILASLAPHLPTRTLALLCRVNSTFRAAFTPHLYRTMTVNDMHRGLRLRRALRLPSSTSYTRILLIDAQHSCDECHAAGSPNLPNLQRLILSFERAAFLQKESSWPDDPCRTLSRVRPETIVVRAHHQLMPDVLGVLRMHMSEGVVRGAKRIVCVASLAPARFRNVTGRLFKPSESACADVSQPRQLQQDSCDCGREREGERQSG